MKGANKITVPQSALHAVSASEVIMEAPPLYVGMLWLLLRRLQKPDEPLFEFVLHYLKGKLLAVP